MAATNSAVKPIGLSQPEVTLFTNASNQGWGGVLGKVTIGGRWTSSEATHHINFLEMLAVFFALKAFQTQLLGKHVCVRIDNMTAVSDIAHIPGKENEAADAESRKARDQTEWALDPEIFQQGTQRLGVKPVIDLFASRLNYKLKPFIAYQPDPEAEAVNAFTISWH
ncbi:Hypothetical predicted protein [Paramuricea clavata]|uniref:Reverse transcriptase RNase H-like domain-containing protein n=1 Tax=Paramuricea clavata TaxID=317549 RepID=A0A7D9HKT8_PARCT|nr:Hypothetical predicted protein [Paramuricea clavata]